MNHIFSKGIQDDLICTILFQPAYNLLKYGAYNCILKTTRKNMDHIILTCIQLAQICTIFFQTNYKSKKYAPYFFDMDFTSYIMHDKIPTVILSRAIGIDGRGFQGCSKIAGFALPLPFVAKPIMCCPGAASAYFTVPFA